MNKISKQAKLEVILKYISGNKSKQEVAKRYGIHYTSFKMLLAAYKTHGVDVLFNPPKPTGTFRVELTSWAIRNNASNTEVAAKSSIRAHVLSDMNYSVDHAADAERQAKLAYEREQKKLDRNLG